MNISNGSKTNKQRNMFPALRFGANMVPFRVTAVDQQLLLKCIFNVT